MYKSEVGTGEEMYFRVRAHALLADGSKFNPPLAPMHK